MKINALIKLNAQIASINIWPSPTYVKPMKTKKIGSVIQTKLTRLPRLNRLVLERENLIETLRITQKKTNPNQITSIKLLSNGANLKQVPKSKPVQTNRDRLRNPPS